MDHMYTGKLKAISMWRIKMKAKMRKDYSPRPSRASRVSTKGMQGKLQSDFVANELSQKSIRSVN